jgi:hypothetical protein
MGWEDDTPLDGVYWCGYDRSSPYRINVARWLDRSESRSWGFAVYRKREVHVYAPRSCSDSDLIETISHEVAHLRKPRYQDKRLEEKKAAFAAADTKLSFEIMQSVRCGVAKKKGGKKKGCK